MSRQHVIEYVKQQHVKHAIEYARATNVIETTYYRVCMLSTPKTKWDYACKHAQSIKAPSICPPLPRRTQEPELVLTLSYHPREANLDQRSDTRLSGDKPVQSANCLSKTSEARVQNTERQRRYLSKSGICHLPQWKKIEAQRPSPARTYTCSNSTNERKPPCRRCSQSPTHPAGWVPDVSRYSSCRRTLLLGYPPSPKDPTIHTRNDLYRKHLQSFKLSSKLWKTRNNRRALRNSTAMSKLT